MASRRSPIRTNQSFRVKKTSKGSIPTTGLRRSIRLLEKVAVTVPLETQPPNSTPRKRSHESDIDSDKGPPTKQQKLFPNQSTNETSFNQASIRHWCETDDWPREDEMQFRFPLLAQKKSNRSLRGKRYLDGSETSEQSSLDLTREEKAAPYKDPEYEETLRLKGFHLNSDDEGPSQKSLERIEEMMKQSHSLPLSSHFEDTKFEKALKKLRDRNEARVLKDIGWLIVPSAESLALDNEVSEDLVESVDEGWALTIPITPIRPQPDYSVGFGRRAFSEEQLEKIRPILGDSQTQRSSLRCTRYMYFCFMAREAKKSDGHINIAERQNGHTMFIAIRALVSLYLLARRVQDVHREILVYSVSHDHKIVQIHGYYPVIPPGFPNTDLTIEFYRHTIRGFDITDRHGAERWTCYKFIKSIYKIWAPSLLEKIKTILNDLPADHGKLMTEVAASTATVLPATGLSQAVAETSISGTDADALDYETPFPEPNQSQTSITTPTLTQQEQTQSIKDNPKSSTTAQKETKRKGKQRKD